MLRNEGSDVLNERSLSTSTTATIAAQATHRQVLPEKTGRRRLRLTISEAGSSVSIDAGKDTR
jgi:hypothetical protein